MPGSSSSRSVGSNKGRTGRAVALPRAPTQITTSAIAVGNRLTVAPPIPSATVLARPPGQLRTAEAIDEVIVDHPDGLHERIADGRPHEYKAAIAQCLGHGTALGAFGGQLGQPLPAVDLGFAVREAPQKLT